MLELGREQVLRMTVSVALIPMDHVGMGRRPTDFLMVSLHLQQGISGVLGQGTLPDPVCASVCALPLSYLLDHFYSLPKPLLSPTVNKYLILKEVSMVSLLMG